MLSVNVKFGTNNHIFCFVDVEVTKQYYFPLLMEAIIKITGLSIELRGMRVIAAHVNISVGYCSRKIAEMNMILGGIQQLMLEIVITTSCTINEIFEVWVLFVDLMLFCDSLNSLTSNT